MFSPTCSCSDSGSSGSANLSAQTRRHHVVMLGTALTSTIFGHGKYLQVAPYSGSHGKIHAYSIIVHFSHFFKVFHPRPEEQWRHVSPNFSSWSSRGLHQVDYSFPFTWLPPSCSPLSGRWKGSLPYAVDRPDVWGLHGLGTAWHVGVKSILFQCKYWYIYSIRFIYIYYICIYYILYKHIFHVCSMCMWNVCTCMYILSSFVQDTDIHYTWDSMFAKCSYKKKWRIQRGEVSSCVWSSYSLQPLFLHVNMFLYIYNTCHCCQEMAMKRGGKTCQLRRPPLRMVGI